MPAKCDSDTGGGCHHARARVDGRSRRHTAGRPDDLRSQDAADGVICRTAVCAALPVRSRGRRPTFREGSREAREWPCSFAQQMRPPHGLPLPPPHALVLCNDFDGEFTAGREAGLPCPRRRVDGRGGKSASIFFVAASRMRTERPVFWGPVTSGRAIPARPSRWNGPSRNVPVLESAPLQEPKTASSTGGRPTSG